MAFEPRVKLWVEKDGKLVLSEYRVQLLAHIAETGSLAEAAKRMGLSYRRAWGKVREMEENLGRPLIETAVGGAHGGGSRLTPLGARLVESFQRFRSELQENMEADFEDLLRQADAK